MSPASFAKKKSIFIDDEDSDEPQEKESHRVVPVNNKVLLNKRGEKTKNKEVVGAMYAMYCLPKSLGEVAKSYRRTRQGVFDLFKRRGYKLRKKKKKGLQVLDGINFTIVKNGYLRATINKKGVLMHHYVWRKHRGKIPYPHYIYHKDGNRQNNKVRNLALGVIRNGRIVTNTKPKKALRAKGKFDKISI